MQRSALRPATGLAAWRVGPARPHSDCPRSSPTPLSQLARARAPPRRPYPPSAGRPLGGRVTPRLVRAGLRTTRIPRGRGKGSPSYPRDTGGHPSGICAATGAFPSNLYPFSRRDGWRFSPLTSSDWIPGEGRRRFEPPPLSGGHTCRAVHAARARRGLRCPGAPAGLRLYGIAALGSASR